MWPLINMCRMIRWIFHCNNKKMSESELNKMFNSTTNLVSHKQRVYPHEKGDQGWYYCVWAISTSRYKQGEEQAPKHVGSGCPVNDLSSSSETRIYLYYIRISYAFKCNAILKVHMSVTSNQALHRQTGPHITRRYSDNRCQIDWPRKCRSLDFVMIHDVCLNSILFAPHYKWTQNYPLC